MVRGASDLIQWFEGTKMPYWRIYPYKNIAGGNITLQSTQEEGQTPGDALEELKVKIRVLHRDHYTIAAFAEPNKLPTKGYHWVHFEIYQSEPGAAVIAGPTGITPDEVQKQITAALNGYKQEVELEQLRKKVTDLEKENKELKSSVDAPLNKVIGALAPYTPQIMGHYFPLQPAVAGLPQPDAGPVDNHIADTVTELTPEQSEVISEFVSAISEVDTDYLNTLRGMTRKIKKDPGIISMVKTFLT
jgi:hypothetical protein